MSKKIMLWLTVGFTMWFMTACGGGGSDAPSNPAPTEYITITSENSDQVLASTVESITQMKDIEDILPILSDASTQESGSVTCSGGGSLTYDSPDGIQGTINFHDCIEHNVYINGKIDFSVNGSNYVMEISAFTMRMYGMTVYYENATISYDENYAYNFSATITGYVSDGMHRADLKNYKIVKDRDYYTLSGLLKTDCMGGWIEVQTVHPIYLHNSCPTAGEILVIGNDSDLRTVFNPDQSVSVFLNSEVYENYHDCRELPTQESACP
jgi:hypothetical protein